MTQQWSATLERQIGARQAVRFTYSGFHSNDLTMAPDLNQIAPNTIGFANLPLEARPFPNWSRINTRDNGGYQDYHDLVFQLRGTLTVGPVAHHHVQVGALSRQHRRTRRGTGGLPERNQRPYRQPLRSRLPARTDDQHPDAPVREQRDLDAAGRTRPRIRREMPAALEAIAGGWAVSHCCRFSRGRT